MEKFSNYIKEDTVNEAKEYNTDILAKLGKKAFGKDFAKVEYEEDTDKHIIELKNSAKEIRYKDLLVFDKNSTSYTIGDIYFEDGVYNIEVRFK